MKDNGADVCMIEHGKARDAIDRADTHTAWPPPERFFGNKMRENWPGTLATMLRDPGRASARVHACTSSRCQGRNVVEFASEQGDTEAQVKSCFNRPNYYVRFLNGEGHCNFKFDYARVAMNRTSTWRRFDYVFVAESNRTALEFGDYVGFEQAMPHSNSAYSTHRRTARPGAPPCSTSWPSSPRTGSTTDLLVCVRAEVNNASSATASRPPTRRFVSRSASP